MNTQTTTIFTDSDIGCWIDGAFGIDHAARKLSIMLISNMPINSGTNTSQFPSTSLAECYQRLSDSAMASENLYFSLSDDHSEFKEATDYLQSVTADGLVWLWEAGDLILTTEDQLD